MFFATYNTKQSSFIDLVNKPRYPINTTPEILSLPQKDINSKGSVRRIIESKTFHDNISEKIKIESLKIETISSLESTISFLFQKAFNTIKNKCEKLMSNSYSYYKGQIGNFRKETENKDKIIRKISATLNSITKNHLLKDPSVT